MALFYTQPWIVRGDILFWRGCLQQYQAFATGARLAGALNGQNAVSVKKTRYGRCAMQAPWACNGIWLKPSLVG